MEAFKTSNRSYSTVVSKFHTYLLPIPSYIQKKCNHEWGEERQTTQTREEWLVLKDISGLFTSPSGKFEIVKCNTQTCLKCGLPRIAEGERKILSPKKAGHKISK